jgi:TIR domain
MSRFPAIMAADFHVFLSHNSKDKPLVREIAARLVAAGLKAWLDVESDITSPLGVLFSRLKKTA